MQWYSTKAGRFTTSAFPAAVQESRQRGHAGAQLCFAVSWPTEQTSWEGREMDGLFYLP